MTDDARKALEVRALRMIRAGDRTVDVTAATGLTADEVAKLRRDFPHTPPSSPTGTLTNQVGAPISVAPTSPPASPIARMLEDASAHSNASVRRLGERIETLLERLRTDLATHAEQERAARAQREKQRKLLEEAARLQAELDAVRAQLGQPKKTVKRNWTPEQRQAAGDRLRAAQAARRASAAS